MDELLASLMLPSLPLDDVVQLRVVCRALQSHTEPFTVALAFGKTRVCFEEFSMTLGEWCDIWGQCAASVMSQNINLSSWGHAIEWVKVSCARAAASYRTFLYDCITEELNPLDAAPFIGRIIRNHAGSSACPAVILSLTGGYSVEGIFHVEALLILSDGCFAVVSGGSHSIYPDVDDEANDYEIHWFAVKIDERLANIAPCFSQDLGGRLRIKQENSSQQLSESLVDIDVGEGSPLLRYAADGALYRHVDFIDWYVVRHIEWNSNWKNNGEDDNYIHECLAYAQHQWDAARPHNPQGDRFVALVGKHASISSALECSSPQTPTQKTDGPQNELTRELLEDEVIQMIVHQEVAAEIDICEAEELVAVLQGSFVEHAVDSLFPQEAVDPEGQEDVYHCKLNRMTASLRTALLSGVPLQQCRAALDGEGHSCEHSSGALVFVQPWQFRSVKRAIEETILFPDNLIFSTSTEHLVQETLDMSKRGSGAWVKFRRKLQVQEDTVSNIATASEPDSDVRLDIDHEICAGGDPDSATVLETLEFDTDIVIHRSFLCLVPKFPAAQVCQSTTDADSRKGLNPRRNSDRM